MSRETFALLCAVPALVVWSPWLLARWLTGER